MSLSTHAFLIITWINPVKMQWIKKASGSISPELSRILAEISSKWGISVPHVYVIDWRKIKIANAFQMGINNYHIFFSNYLIENLTPGEIAAIMTHELAHARMKHVAWLNVIQWSLTFAAINLFGFAFVFLNQGAALIINQGAAVIIATSLIIAGSIISLGGIGVILPFIQRRFESAADLEAIKIIDGHFLISALEKLAHLNLTPSKFPKYSNMSHPSTNQRVERIRLAMAENS